MPALDGLLEQIALPGFDGEVWTTHFDMPACHIGQLATSLSSDELTRAERFAGREDRDRFIVTRASLRVLLGRHLRIAPQAVVLAYGERGKPYVQDRAAQIHFNLSHSGKRALYAVTTRPVGIDVECLHRDLSWQRLARRFFTPRESAALLRLPEKRQKYAFLACWTRKEAVAKATGKGLSLPLHAIEVSVDPCSVPRVLGGAGLAAAEWALCTPDVGPGYVATIATYDAKRD